MDRTCVLVNPFPRSSANGVTSYLDNLTSFLQDAGVPFVCISNDDQLTREQFQGFVCDRLVSRFRADEIVIEAPEVKAPTLLLPPEFPVHIRLHCPHAIVETHNGWPVHWGQFAEEMQVVRRARVVSSPSYALLRVLHDDLDAGTAHVYKNPPPWRISAQTERARKKRDLVYLGRFMRSKGAESLAPLLRRLPDSLTVALAGRESDRFGVPSEADDRVTLFDEIAGPERLYFLSEGRLSLLLSRFENCSMTILESLAVGTVVVGWRVGGNAEIGPSRLIRTVPLDDLDALAATIVALLQEPYPEPEEFRSAIAQVAADFRAGWQRVWSTFQQPTPVPVYRGMDCSA
jgi:glycosyltransferase involved in cell wall biosynthesis